MDGVIFLRGEGDELTELREEPFESEDVLQRLLASHPALLSGSQINPAEPRRWLLVRREAGIPSAELAGDHWYVDHLLLDQDGVPTLVEVKRSDDSRIRREVVGQMLDYAANAVLHWPVETIRHFFESRCEEEGVDSTDALMKVLEPGEEPERFWQSVKTNLQAGKLRLLFVADQIPVELRRVVEYLNAQMDSTEVLAVELKQYSGERLITLVPTVIGHTADAQRRKGGTGARNKWDEGSFFGTLERDDPASVDMARTILEWARSHVSRVWWGEGKQYGSFVPILDRNGRKHQLFAVWTYGYVEIYFYWYQYKAPFDDEAKRRELLARLNSIRGVDLPDDSITRRPSIPLPVLSGEAERKSFLQTFDWVVDEIQRT